MDTKERNPNYSETIDKTIQAAIGKWTQGISPAAFMMAFYDWYLHFIIHPAKHTELINLFYENMVALQRLSLQTWFNFPKEPEKEGTTKKTIDKRFAGQAWQHPPFNFLYESFLMIQKYWHEAATHVPGVSKHHEDVVNFVLRQILDMFSPSNFLLTNPEIQQATFEQKGANLESGFQNFMDDLRRYELKLPPAGAENFVIGKNIALSPGKVIFRNRLMELIQYFPQTDTVYAEPILITPAWIMKYYILDLSPKHSLVKYLVKKGHTVFMISWKNPTKEDRNLGMDDYLNLGIIAALDVISTLMPNQKIQLVGYCLGGTLAAIAAATLARENDERLASLTLFAAQTDFNDPGELGLFIDESQISFLENIMSEKGFLDTHQMSGAFQLLRSNDLIWSRMIHHYLLGTRKPLTDLMAWNADATRLPYRMHSEYLRNLFLDNQLAEGSYLVGGNPISLIDIRVPIFVVSTERDHVSPWRSVFKIIMLTSTDVTFTLTSGGHNVGIVSIPVKKTKRYYRISTILDKDRYLNANNWYKNTKKNLGSWWPAWEEWISKQSSQKIPPPKIGSIRYPAMEDAPGLYVLEN